LIGTKTVFVLGAGASFPYGFPLGSELKKLVLECYKDDKPHAAHLYNTTAFSKAAAIEFITALQYSGLSKRKQSALRARLVTP
jgi:hypothetical protein